MKNTWKKNTALLLAAGMVLGLVSPALSAENAQAAGQPKLNKKSMVISKGKTKVLTLKNASGAKKIKWSVKNKKIATIKKSKTSVKVKAKKVGSTSVVCRFSYNGKTLRSVCKVKVVAKSAASNTQTANTSSTPAETSKGQPQATAENSGLQQAQGGQNAGQETATAVPSQGGSDNSGATTSAAPTVNPSQGGSDNSGATTSAAPAVTPSQGGSDNSADTTPAAPTVTPAQSGSGDLQTPAGGAQTTPAGNATATPVSANKATATPAATNPAKAGVLMDNDYSDGSTGGFSGRGTASVQSVTDETIANVPVLYVSGRTNTWHGAETNLSDELEAGKTYQVSSAVYQNQEESATITLTLAYDDSSGETKYLPVQSVTTSKGEWASIDTTFSVPADTTNFILYFESSSASLDFYVAPLTLFDTEQYTKILSDDFEDESLSNFNKRSADLQISEDGVIGKSLQVTGRTAAWNGVSSNASIKPGASVYVSGYVKTDAAGCTFQVSAQGTDADGAATYPNLLKTSLKQGEWTKFSCVYTFDKEDYQSMDCIYFEMTDTASKYPDFYLDNVSVCVIKPTDSSNIQADETYDITGSLLESFSPFFANVGTCINYNQLTSDSTFSMAKSQYNSITPENETKPDALLSGTQSTATAKNNKYYYIPEGYSESTCPNINFSKIDTYMEKAYNNNMRIRFHVFVWHQQTPKWFFKENYNASGDWVNADTMNLRTELYIKTVINYISAKEKENGYGDVVYCYDVANEYFHNNNNTDSSGTPYKSYWDEVYYPNNEFDTSNPDAYEQVAEPVYVKNAFQYARDMLDSWSKTDVSLFYNDFNTYVGDTPEKILTMMAYINKEKTLCNGIGMQSHLDVSYPSVALYTNTLKKFLESEYVEQVQITELDVTAYEKNNKTLEDQMDYYYNLITGILKVQKSYPEKMTGLTFWGLYDSVSWRKDGYPLLFSSTTKAKGVYFKVLQAAAEAAAESEK